MQIVTHAQTFPSSLETYAFRLKPHEDLKKGIVDFAKVHGIKAGVILTCVGSLEQYHLRFANQPEGTKASGHFEIVSMTGTFSDSSSHIHISVADKNGAVIGGHLLDGSLIYTTAEIAIGDLTDYSFERKKDPTYGYPELDVRRRKNK